MVALSLSGVILTTYPIYRGLRMRSLDLFEPPVIVALLSFEQLLRPLYWLIIGGPVLPDYNVLPDRVFRACTLAALWVDIGFVVYYLCYYGLPPLRRLVAVIPRFSPRWSRSRLIAVVVTYSVIGLASYLVFMWQVGGFRYFLAHLAARSYVAEGLQPFVVGTQILAVAWLLGALYATSHGKRLWPYVIAGIPAFVIISTLGGRGYVLYPVLFCFGFRHYLVRRASLTRMALLVICFVVFALGYRDLRDATATEPTVGVRVLEESKWALSDLLPQLFEQQKALPAFAVMIDDMPKHLQFQHGRTWLYLLTLPIPRKIWPDKPITLEGRIFGEAYFNDSAGQPPGYAGVLYMNFSYFGIVPGFALLAIFHKSLYKYLAANQNNAMAVCLYVTTVTTLFDFSNLQITLWLFWQPFLVLAFMVVRMKVCHERRLCTQPKTPLGAEVKVFSS